ncbi:cytochrome P450 [Pararhodobacter sp.]|uniref:cytochrome P450 n=1 Tax=Pararhodobacter sp. TaxID=2127056 RepID=UPI002B003B63|nr:cytochrome P450 [Pararhodobacter sp.]
MTLLDVPRIALDPFTYETIPDNLEIMREALAQAPVCWLEPYGVYVTGRHALAQVMFKEWEVFTSTVKAFGEREFIRKTLVQEDPPDHGRVRKPMMSLFSPLALKEYDAYFRAEAEKMADEIVAMGEVYGVEDIAARYVLKVFPDILGVIDMDRPRLLPWADLAFNSNVPGNQVFLDCKARSGDVLEWFAHQMRRENFRPDSMGGQIFRMADEGILSLEDAQTLVVIIFSAGFDTTILAIGNGLKLLADNPDQWDRLREAPELVRTAFEETLRMEPPARSVGRGVTRDTDLWGVPLRAGDKVASFLNVVGRDPAVWDDPDSFRVDRRKVLGHMAFGAGVHACAGQALSRMEYSAIIGALVSRVRRIEPTGPAERKINNNASGFARVPLRLIPA